MKLYKFGKVPWLQSQLIYHALARLGREALCLLSPSTPYVCIGFHQDVEIRRLVVGAFQFEEGLDPLVAPPFVANGGLGPVGTGFFLFFHTCL